MISTFPDHNLIDIEDIFKKNEPDGHQRIYHDDVVLKVKISHLEKDDQKLESYLINSFVPGWFQFYLPFLLNLNYFNLFHCKLVSYRYSKNIY